ncbi:CHAT domain-containing protein [Leptospira sp. 2 VSF19]|uniref:CHAT domain-containing protein n=1 Tax=Leptospira soteropolitanensis TaxID=2950025 RepID=A0AAW5VKZ6_9LEPT|nr:CHAT domain-containing protein [Leptospira soteropolitanensis]MCW7493079.1 CHAT domain-containing protein [Leptospira soteropolitanensis]MCW7500852.1 CHAT domain-containing protein [Leptospira soteropolitanensis]MCW7522929.1 CHAT domain-containing protein [Leptospira soteropolitanensis]MCW7526964.1 CHAT domain-containing protein [Leptospira soteropolitanensis]MCW7530647.1 CHAT domain-containing protein [Leptospira soteropolitanensis]
MKLRIIAKFSRDNFTDGECIWEEKQENFGNVERTTKFSGKILNEFLKDWALFVERVLSQKPNKEEFLEKLGKKSDNLEQIVFGKALPFWRKPGFTNSIQLLIDPEFSPIPWEILRTHKGFLFQDIEYSRGIRIETIQKDHKQKTNTAILICNPVKPNLIATVKEECANLFPIFEKKLNLRILKENHLTRVRLIEEIGSAKYLHYAGHTEKNGIPIGANDFLYSQEIAEHSFTNLDLVFFNSCHSSFDSIDHSGLTTGFLKAGAKEVIGFLFPVETNLAKEIGIKFWDTYLKTKNSRKSLAKIRKSLYNGSSNEIITAISLVHFSTNTPKLKFRQILGVIFVLVLLFFFIVFLGEKKDNIRVEGLEISPFQRVESKKPKKETNFPKDSVSVQISQIKNPEFRKMVQHFLKTDHEFLDDSQKREIIDSILSKDISEEKMYYEFKTRSGY